MNKLDKQYTALLQDILDNGVTKQDRTGTGTLSVFGRQIKHKMSDGFPLLTTKRMPFKTITTELLWFLRGDTNIKFLVDNNCHIWDGDAYKSYEKWYDEVAVHSPFGEVSRMTKESFIKAIGLDEDWAKRWGDLGPIYGKQWRSWKTSDTKSLGGTFWGPTTEITENSIDQIQNLINDIKTNPDSRRLMVSAWNVGELDQMTLPPCHYGFQVYTRELGQKERLELYRSKITEPKFSELITDEDMIEVGLPTRAISLMWNQRSVDTFLGLPFNIASYGLLLEIIAKEVNMVPDELISNLGDTHLYSNHIEQAKEQIGRELTHDERVGIACKPENGIIPVVPMYGDWDPTKEKMNQFLDEKNIPKRTREPYPLPSLNIKLHFNNEPSFVPEHWLVDDFEIVNYQSHPHIKAPLSN
jgi:thymidylate synthase